MAKVGVLITMAFLLNGVLGGGQYCDQDCKDYLDAGPGHWDTWEECIHDQLENGKSCEDGGGRLVVLQVVGIVGGIFLAILMFFCGCRRRNSCGQRHGVWEQEDSDDSQPAESSITIDPLPYNPSYYGDAPVAPIAVNAPIAPMEDDLPSYDQVAYGNYTNYI